MNQIWLNAVKAAQAGNVATYTVTTTGAQTHILFSLGVSASTIVDWGDGSDNTYTGTAQRTHDYASAGTWTVQIQQPENVTHFDMRDNKVTLNSAGIAPIINVSVFFAFGLRNDGTFNSVDVSAWRPSSFLLYNMPAGYAGTFDSADVSAWRPGDFRLFNMPAGYAGTFDSADVSAWRPGNFLLFGMPAGYAGTFNSVDVSAWRPSIFQLFSMPAGYAGTFNSVDVSAWRPSTFQLLIMPAGYAGTFDSADVSAWRPSTFLLYNMPVATFTFTISSSSISGWTTTSNFQINSNGLNEASVNSALYQLHQASTTPRTATGGTINVGGSNAAPSGTFQAAASCPVTSSTPGKEIAHELLNDTCDAFANHWTTVTITA